MGGAYVTAYESRPQLYLRSERNRRFIAHSFVEAVDQDRNVPTEDLRPAYRVAGDAFIGKMKRRFIILDDDEAVRQPAKAGNHKKNVKRQASGDGPSGSKKKPPQPAMQ
jgi:hypothetical protein